MLFFRIKLLRVAINDFYDIKNSRCDIKNNFHKIIFGAVVILKKYISKQ